MPPPLGLPVDRLMQVRNGRDTVNEIIDKGAQDEREGVSCRRSPRSSERAWDRRGRARSPLPPLSSVHGPSRRRSHRPPHYDLDPHDLIRQGPVEQSTGELDEVSLAYATTVHKSQGSEYPAVVIPLGMPHYMLLERNLLYAAVTRGKRLVVVIGQTKALAMAVKRAGSGKRLTNLQAPLQQAVHGETHGI